MKKEFKRHSGFTLIEMVAVIIILAIMAASALPRFVNLSQDARLSTIQGLAGGLRSAVALAKSQWIAANSGTQNFVSMNGQNVSVVYAATPGSTVNNLGVPLEGTTGIDLALDSFYGYSSNMVAGTGEVWYPTGVTNSAICSVIYTSGTVSVTAVTALDCA